ncbi:hypothetical protein Nepgr_025092 [Nepenthes gracilis]|uniref:Leucine-rich repeat-containing N-terminal plant-type domain-containing protein n=1 Tax=Nepenthes gracilis TaxID=150966 RepID=A0AAD3Y0N3_NEPGR|nr:hypothetical protein Nepgr_025092 [Nepenthes gracilis]
MSITTIAAFSTCRIIIVLACLVFYSIADANNGASVQLHNNSAASTQASIRKSRKNKFCSFSFLPFRSPLRPPIPSTLKLLMQLPSPHAPPSSPPATPPPQPSAATSAPSPNQLILADQRLAVVYPIIQKFKSIITSDPLNITETWVGDNICNYTGFYCDHPPDNSSAIALASIDFNGHHLSAPTIDGFLDQLSDLALFHANSNNFSGTISTNMSKRRYLYELDISNNMFSGPFPASVAGINGLTFLDIRFNRFSGSVPPAIFTQNLDVLFLNDNNFMSNLPTVSNYHISYLTLADNKFSCPIPSDIYKTLSALTEVLLLNNQLMGCLPSELGLLKGVTVFDVSKTMLTGPLPFSLACLEEVEVLNFAENLLYGIVPDVLCELPNLANLTLSDSYFTHVGTACKSLIDSRVLDVRNNCIPTLPSQRSVKECTYFFAVPRICPSIETYETIPCTPPHFR